MAFALRNVFKYSAFTFRVPTYSIRLQSSLNQQNNINITSFEAQDDMPVPMENPFQKEKQQCILCKMDIQPDYKNVKLLSQFISPFTGRVYGRHITGLCRKRQEQVEREITKSQDAGFMPYYFKEPIFAKDPKLFDPNRPFRPHNF